MIISPSRNFIFIHLEKCGGTSIEVALQDYLYWSDIILGSTDFGERIQQAYYERYSREKVNNSMLWKHSTAKDIHAFIGYENWNDFQKISIVRDPEELIKSLYKFSRTTVSYHLGRIHKNTWKDYFASGQFPETYPYSEGYVQAYVKSHIEDSGFNGFVRILFNDDHNFIKPQFERLEVNKNIHIGSVFELSDLNNKWSEILDMLKLPENIKLEKLNSSSPFDIEVSNKSKKTIQKHFAIDYDMLPKYTGIKW